jgi:hypothetical protein
MPIPAAAWPLLQLAPHVARWLAGDKAGDIAEKAVSVGGILTGKTTPAEIAEALKNNQELLLKFQESMAQVNLEMARLDAEIEKTFLADVQNARQRDIEFIKSGQTNTRANIMLAMAFGTVVAISWLLASGRIENGTDIAAFLMTIGGMFARDIGAAFSFEFGSSRGSKQKDFNQNFSNQRSLPPMLSPPQPAKQDFNYDIFNKGVAGDFGMIGEPKVGNL